MPNVRLYCATIETYYWAADEDRKLQEIQPTSNWEEISDEELADLKEFVRRKNENRKRTYQYWFILEEKSLRDSNFIEDIRKELAKEKQEEAERREKKRKADEKRAERRAQKKLEEEARKIEEAKNLLAKKGLTVVPGK